MVASAASEGIVTLDLATGMAAADLHIVGASLVTSIHLKVHSIKGFSLHQYT